MFNKNKLFQVRLFVSVSGKNEIGETEICPLVCGWTLLRCRLKAAQVLGLRWLTISLWVQGSSQSLLI